MLFNHSQSKRNQDLTCLNEAEINALQQKSKNCQLSFSESIRTSSEFMMGDMQSQIRGEGIDFEENKAYLAGSDSRHINWRMYAKTQQLYVNIYNEDKRPSTYLVFDQRPTMYFGTRKQLKIKLALKFAVYSLLLAANQQHSTSGVQIGLKPTWHNSYSSSNSILSFIESLNRPCLDNINMDDTPSINDILNKLNLTDGAEVIIISDLHDMDDTTISCLYNLSRRFKISLVQVQDPVEKELPTNGIFNIQKNIHTDPIQLHCTKNIVNSYQKEYRERFEDYKHKCLTMGVSFSRYTTTDNIF